MTLPADLPAEQARVLGLANEIQASADQEEWYFHNGVCEEEYHADLRKYAEVLGELARVREALARIENEAAHFESENRGVLRDLEGWFGPRFDPDESDETLLGLMPAIDAALAPAPAEGEGA